MIVYDDVAALCCMNVRELFMRLLIGVCACMRVNLYSRTFLLYARGLPIKDCDTIF